MSTELFVVNELGALIAPLVGLGGSLLASKRWKAKLLLFGQMAALVFALSGLAMALTFGQSVVWLSIRLDLVTSCLLAGITLIAAVVVAFSERYLGGERSRQNFLLLLSFLSSCSAWLVSSDNFIVAFVCWNLLSWGLWRVMLLQEDGAAKKSASTVLRHHLLSDIALFCALLVVYEATGSTAFSQLGSLMPQLNNPVNLFGLTVPLTAGATASLLFVLSFSIKSALFPFHRWLLATLDAPTPLSGLLHAGVVNVSAILAWRTMPVLQENPAVLIGWGCLSALSALVGTLSMSAQPDVKRKLVYSTIGQMGFMCLQCASGAIGAALFHLLAHGMFKCHMFLQSGSAVAEGVNKRKFGYGESQSENGKAKFFIVATTLLCCAAVYLLCLHSGWTALSALVAGSAVLCVVPSLSRIDLKVLSIFWLSTLAIAFLSAFASNRLESLFHFGSTTMALLPMCLGLFAIIAIALHLARKSRFAKALYVHSLNGFYADDIALAASRRLCNSTKNL